MIDITRAPFPVTYREVWLPRAINNHTTLPTSIVGGHGLTLTGAQKRTTADGVQFSGAATSNINCGAIHNTQARIGCRFRFKLGSNYAAGSGDRYLAGKYIDGDNYLRLYLSTADGLLHLKHRSVAVDLFDISVGPGTFTAHTWYDAYFATGQQIVGGAASDGARLRLDNGVAATNADVTALPNGGDLVFGDYDDPGAGTGFQGIIEDIFFYTDSVTAVEETNNYIGIPNADAVHIYLLDEGRGVTANDRGSGPANGTLDTAATWAFSQVEQPVLSSDGINDVSNTAALVNIRGNYTAIWVGKAKSTFPVFGANPRILVVVVDGNNEFRLLHTGAGGLRFNHVAAGVTYSLNYLNTISIDDYIVAIATGGTLVSMFVNGSFVDSLAAVAIGAGLATAYFNRDSGASNWSNHKTLFAAIAEAAFTENQAKAYSRWARDVFNLPTSI